jgi:apolipoprotein N-acyltransferase
MSSEKPQENQIPLVVDLDGTLIKTDLLWESLARLLRRNPFALFANLFWWTRGRAFLKKKLAARVTIDPATLPYHEPFLKFLRDQKAAGRKIILATASDLQMAKPVADYVGLFDEVLGSDGKTNLRGGNKLKALVARFGERGFDYAGNSSVDLAVWPGARNAIVVNAGHALVRQAANCAKLGPMFTEGYSPLYPALRFCSELFIRSGYLAAIGAGLILAAAFLNPGIAGCAWVAPALMLACARGKNGGDSFRVGYVAGLAFWLASLYWLLHMPVAGLPILGWIALSAFVALYPAVWVWLLSCHSSLVTRHTWLGRLLWSLAGAAAWVALEMIRAWLLGGFPWNFLGASQYQMVPLIQLAAVTGVYGVSFLVVWTSLSLFSAARMILHKSTARQVWQLEIMLPFATVVGLFVFGEIQLERGRSDREFQSANRATEPPALLRITLIQPSVPQTLIWDERENTNRFRELFALSERVLTNQADLLIWPESAVPEFNNASYMAITNLVRARRVSLVFNANDVVPHPNATNAFDNDIFNAAFLFTPDGHWTGTYHKQKLVIFGEYIPLVRWLPFVKWFTPITDSFAAGSQPVQFEINIEPERNNVGVQVSAWPANTLKRELQRATASPLICYEDMFPQVARKAVRDDTDFLVNLTNDGWFGDSAEQWQHMAGGVFRAVENGVPLVRCCNNGVTCWIDAHGRVRDIFRDKSGGVYGEGSLTFDLPLQPRAPTFYNRHGDWFGWGCVGFSCLLITRRFAKQKTK